MLYLVTGVPGAGKTLYAIDQLIIPFLKSGRTVYSDIEELNLSHLLDSPKLLRAPEDWRKTPDGSVVVYDECQRRFGAEGRGGGRSEKESIAAMETHRHSGHDIILITQHPNLLHVHVRRLVGRHSHLHRQFEGVNVFTYDRCLKVDSKGDLAQAERVSWTHPKRLFGCYNSATVHTHKFKVPKQLKWIALLVCLTLFFGYRTVTEGQMFAAVFGSKAEAEETTVYTHNFGEAPASIVSAGDVPVLKPSIGGCIASERLCQCYDRALEPITLPEAVCRVTAAQIISLHTQAPAKGRAPARPAGAPL